MIPCKFQVFLFVFCLDDLPIGESGVLKSPTITVLESVWEFMSRSIVFEIENSGV